MLSAFQAQPLVDFKQRDKSKIESLLAYGMALYENKYVRAQTLTVDVQVIAFLLASIQEACASTELTSSTLRRPCRTKPTVRMGDRFRSLGQRQWI